VKAMCALIVVVGASVLTAVACSKDQSAGQPTSQHEDIVLTTFYPMTYFARQIAGDLVPVECLVPAGEDPIFWRPSREALQRYSNAKLVAINGAGFEKWTQQASLPASRVVNTSAGLEPAFISYETEVTHSHGPGGEHSHTGTDGHTWLGDDMVLVQIANLTEAMIKQWPEHEEVFMANTLSLTEDLTDLKLRCKDEIDLEGVKLIASHPAYNYLARSNGWAIKNLDLDPDEGLTDEVIAKINEAIGDHEGKVVLLWESEPAIDPEIIYPFENVTFSPAELPVTGSNVASPNYIEIMNANIDRLVETVNK
jgi:zinc transport system substrate-binding protein